MRTKVTLSCGLEGTLTLRDAANRAAPAPSASRPNAGTPEQVAAIVRALAGSTICEREAMYAITLDNRGNVIGSHQLTVGTLASTVVHPRDVFRAALADNAAALILAHNHPSGDPAPSAEDYAVTSRLADAGRLLGIHFLDHVVVTASSFRSFRDEGWLR